MVYFPVPLLCLSVCLFDSFTLSFTHPHSLSLFLSGLCTSFVALREPSQLRLSSQFQEKLLSWHLKLICKLGLDQFGAVGALLWHWHWPPIMLSCWLQRGSIRHKPNALCSFFFFFLNEPYFSNSGASVAFERWLSVSLCVFWAHSFAGLGLYVQLLSLAMSDSLMTEWSVITRGYHFVSWHEVIIWFLFLLLFVSINFSSREALKKDLFVQCFSWTDIFPSKVCSWWPWGISKPPAAPETETQLNKGKLL